MVIYASVLLQVPLSEVSPFIDVVKLFIAPISTTTVIILRSLPAVASPAMVKVQPAVHSV